MTQGGSEVGGRLPGQQFSLRASLERLPRAPLVSLGEITWHYAIASAAGTPVPIYRQLLLHDGSFLINFATAKNVTYFVLYSSDMINWKTSPQPVFGDGNPAQWIDYGPPVTDSLPGIQAARFYKVVSQP